ncbi:MAG: DUF2092 domain-containing protein [Pseudomonadota bacterium]
MRLWGVVFAASLSAGLAFAQEGSAPAEDPLDADAANAEQAIEIARASAAFIAQQERLGFRWFLSFDEVLQGREKLTFVASGQNVLDREQGFLFSAERDVGRRDYYYDGAVFTISAPEEDFYTSIDFEGGFDRLIEVIRERSDTVPPLWAVMSTTLPDRLMATVEGAAYLGITRIAGQEVHHLAFHTYDEDWQLWVSTDETMPVPLMLVGTDTYQQGWPQYRAHMMDWTFEPEIDPSAFVFVADEDDEAVSIAQARPDTTAAGALERRAEEAAEDAAGEGATSNGEAE